MIQLENISHKYSVKPVIDGLSVSFEKNTITCILGGSGSGKTTLLRIIAGLETPEKGTVVINGNTVTSNGKIIVRPSKRNTGFIFQDLALWPHFTVYKNIAFGLYDRKEENINSKVENILAFFGLEAQKNKYPHQLSGGQQQLVAIARSLVLKPEILLMDEPLANLDVKLKRKILNHISTLKSEFNLTIVYVTHDHREAFAIADEIKIINQGKVEDEGTPRQIRHSDNEYVKYFVEY